MNNRRLQNSLDKLRQSVVALRNHVRSTGMVSTRHDLLLEEAGKGTDPPLLTDRVTFRKPKLDKDPIV